MNKLKVTLLSILLLCLSGCLVGEEYDFDSGIEHRIKLVSGGKFLYVEFNEDSGKEKHRSIELVKYSERTKSYRLVGEYEKKMEYMFLPLSKEYYVLKFRILLNPNSKVCKGDNCNYVIVKKTPHGFIGYNVNKSAEEAMKDKLGIKKATISRIPFHMPHLNQQFFVNLVNDKKYRSKFEVSFTVEKV